MNAVSITRDTKWWKEANVHGLPNNEWSFTGPLYDAVCGIRELTSSAHSESARAVIGVLACILFEVDQESLVAIARATKRAAKRSEAKRFGIDLARPKPGLARPKNVVDMLEFLQRKVKDK